ncbi:nucleotidyltransferase family protein [Roseibaca sp. Y0-43]|uniref:nucleotidyltransferase family protein n=1 Tax=Roseibaca sp. Y0-43 TaxID=2816854 RepID=UPI001D0C062D|nr:nucleotidyltransferase family protein [Roseibaca sp. Y0-43]MCC1480720.1 nucleotidyltransferase family protein [Roseibaca sp. Y0-43]
MSRAILLPAAGASSRMRGRDKLLKEVDGVALLRRSAMRALATGAAVAVTLPLASARIAALDGLRLTLLDIDATEGMAASLRAGGAWAEGLGTSALMIALPDMPDITTDDMTALFAAHDLAPATPLRATTEDGRPGHPVILPQAVFPAVQRLSGDQGARAILADLPPRLHSLPGQRALTDLDTPEAWTAWREQS